MDPMFVTEETSHPPMSSLKEGLFLNAVNMVVTPEMFQSRMCP